MLCSTRQPGTAAYMTPWQTAGLHDTENWCSQSADVQDVWCMGLYILNLLVVGTELNSMLSGIENISQTYTLLSHRL